MKLSRFNRFLLLTLCAATSSGNAAILTWNGGTGTWDVATTANWLNDVPASVEWPAPGGTDDDAVFPAANTVSINTGGVIANDITFNVTGSILNGDTLTLNGTTPTVTTVAGTATINSVVAGSAGMIKAGAGTLVISGINSGLSGIVQLNAGTLRATTDAAALGAGTLTLNGGTLQLANNSGLTFGRNTTLTANTTITADRLASAATSTTHALGTLSIGANTLTISRGSNITGAGIGGISFTGGTLTGNAAFSTGASSTLTISGEIGGVGFGITKSGTGSLVLSGDNTYSGTTTISTGTLFIGSGTAAGSLGGGAVTNNGTLNFNRTGTHTVANDIAGTGGITISSAAASNPTFSGTLGVTSISIGARSTVTFGGSSANTTGNVTVTTSPSNNVSTLILAKPAGVNAVSGDILLGGTSGSSGRLQLAASDQIPDTSTVTMSPGGAYSHNAIFSLLGKNETIGWLAGNQSRGAVTIQNASNTDSVLTLAGNTTSKTITNGGSGGSVTIQNGTGTGKLAIVKNGTGTQVINAANLNHTGTTTINVGTFSITSSNMNTSATTLAGGTLNLTSSTFNAALSGTSGQVTVTGTANSNFGGGNKTYSVDTVLSGTSPTLTQTVANSLSASSLHNIGSGATLRTGNLAGSVKALTGTGSVDLNGTSANLTIADGAGQDFGGAIGGTGKLTKSGAGTQTLSGTNTYTGNTTVNAGTLVLSSSGSLKFKPTTNGTSNKVTGVGTATLNGTLVLDLTSANLTSGNSWTLVDVTTPEYGLVGISSPGLVFMHSSGVWTATSGFDTWTFNQGSGVLSHTITAGYTPWALSKGLDGTSGKENGALDDPNNNGIDNVVEYVLNGEPLLAESPEEILPILDASESNFIFTFTRRVESATDTTQIFEYGTDLGGWTPLNITAPVDDAVTLGTQTGGSPNLQSVTVTVPKGANTEMFGRLKVSKP